MGNRTSSKGSDPVYKTGEEPKPELTFTEEDLRARLTEQQYNVTQQKATEKAWSGQYVNVKEDGSFNCVVCETILFKTDKKFESSSGWPSFSDVAKKGNVVRIVDDSLGMVRTEVVCGKCGAHLGHVFDDGPQEDTGLRYCINSASLAFECKGGKKEGKAMQEASPGGEGTEASPGGEQPEGTEVTPGGEQPEATQTSPGSEPSEGTETSPGGEEPEGTETLPGGDQEQTPGTESEDTTQSDEK